MSTSRTGLSLKLGVTEDTEVTDIRFEIERVACEEGEDFPPFDRVFTRPLEDIRLPGDVPGFEGPPFDNDSSHAFADQFVTVPKGCYSVTTTPLYNGSESPDCESSSARAVRVDDGKTTEVYLINQCRNEPMGGIDVVALLNHAPQLMSLTFEDSKFVLQCRPQEICATMRDPDADPLEFVWTKDQGPELFSEPEVTSTEENNDGSVTQCIRVVGETPGSYRMKVVAYDLMNDPFTGTRIRIEQYLQDNGLPYTSNDQLKFPFYVADDEQLDECEGAIDDDGDDGQG